MINVTYKKRGAVREFACVGHAGYTGGGGSFDSADCVRSARDDGRAAGGDIVCAAASALCGALVATLLKHDEEFFSLFVTEGDGECRVTCAGAAAKPYFEFALVGLKKLAEAFPDNVRVSGYGESEGRL